MRQIRFRLGLRHRPRCGSSQHSPTLPTRILGGSTSKKERERKREGTERERRGKKERVERKRTKEERGGKGKKDEAPNRNLWLRHCRKMGREKWRELAQRAMYLADVRLLDDRSS